MAYVITEPCIAVKDTACVVVCPVDCIHPRPDEADFTAEEMLYIDPDNCIGCGLCVAECPVKAIFAIEDTPTAFERYIAINAEYFVGKGDK